MKKAKYQGKDELRAEYRRADFSGRLWRGKYAARLAASSNIVVLDPEIHEAFPTSKAVNDALGVLLQAAKSARGTVWGGRGKRSR